MLFRAGSDFDLSEWEDEDAIIVSVSGPCIPEILYGIKIDCALSRPLLRSHFSTRENDCSRAHVVEEWLEGLHFIRADCITLLYTLLIFMHI